MRIRHGPRRVGALVALLTGVGALACEIPGPTAPRVDGDLVVFSVLDPAATEQTILLMRSRVAVKDTTTRTVTIEDPIVSAGEIPVTGARVVLRSPTGDSAVAVEDRTRRTDGLGAGVYRIWSAGNPATLPAGAFLPVTQGARYTLQVRSTLGNAEGTTRVPSSTRVFNVAARNINLSRDSVILGDAVVSAAGYMYALRSGGATDGDPQFRRVLERRLILPSGNEWAFAFVSDRLRLGNRRTLTVVAADSNYFDYYGAEGDPFADRTSRTTLRGAAGVFGSVLLLYSGIVTIIGP